MSVMPPRGSQILRFVFWLHRYLGIAVGALMLMWCLSGVVMLYITYPSVSDRDRAHTLPTLNLQHCCAAIPDLDSDSALDGVRVEMLGPRPILIVGNALDFEQWDLATGAAISEIGEAEARSVATSFAVRAGIPDTAPAIQQIDRDQWTVSQEFDSQRPLYRLSWHDRAGSQLYVSAVTGREVQFTTTVVRAWNWLGSVPHWLYFADLRANPSLWDEVVVYTSLIGCFLAVTGLVIGIRQWSRRPANQSSPYRGWMWWHHVPGLVFGVLLLTWVLSGLLSMNPWGLMESGGAGAERRRLVGTAPTWNDVRASLTAFSASQGSQDWVSLQSSSFQGQLFWIVTQRDGTRVRLDKSGHRAAVSSAQLAQTAALLGMAGQMPQQLSAGDEYYFYHHSERVELPVYRLLANDAESTRFYIDPISGDLIRKFDSASRHYRWWHEALHRLDFAQLVRARPIWDIVIVTLLLGATLIAATGTFAACRYLSGSPLVKR